MVHQRLGAIHITLQDSFPVIQRGEQVHTAPSTVAELHEHACFVAKLTSGHTLVECL